MESNVSIMSTNNIVATRFSAYTPSRIRLMVKICDIVDLFLWKLFWFFLSMPSILGSIRLPYFQDTNLYKVSSKKILCFPTYILGCNKTLLFSWLYKLRLNFSFLDTNFYNIGSNKMSHFFHLNEFKKKRIIIQGYILL